MTKTALIIGAGDATGAAIAPGICQRRTGRLYDPSSPTQG